MLELASPCCVGITPAAASRGSLQAAHSVTKSQLPIKANLFYASHMRPSRPFGTSLDVKRSTHKKLLPFLQACM